MTLYDKLVTIFIIIGEKICIPRCYKIGWPREAHWLFLYSGIFFLLLITIYSLVEFNYLIVKKL